MPYKLKAKENEFQVTREGKFEYKHFKHGEIYESVPEEEKERFDYSDLKSDSSDSESQ
jgi:hypothetical protein